MRHFWLKLIKLSLFTGAMDVTVANASSYVVTAEMTRIRCSNGNQVYMEPLQVLQLTDEIDRATYRVRLPSKFSRRCPEGRVSSFSVYNLGSLTPDPDVEESPSLSKRRSERVADEEGRYREGYYPYSSGFALVSPQAANELFRKISTKLVPQCRKKFLGSNGFGAWGEHAKDIMSIGFFEETLERNKTAFSRVCPAYRTMNVEQKKNLVILSMMAQFSWESSCNPSAANYDCPNGTCYGIAQLHLGHENSNAYLKMKQFKKYCPRNASKSATQSISCSIAMFMEDLWQGESIVGNSKSYWETERPGNKYATRYESLFSKIPDCKKSSSSLASRSQSSKRPKRVTENTVDQRRPYLKFQPAEDSASNRVPIGSI